MPCRKRILRWARGLSTKKEWRGCRTTGEPAHAPPLQQSNLCQMLTILQDRKELRILWRCLDNTFQLNWDAILFFCCVHFIKEEILHSVIWAKILLMWSLLQRKYWGDNFIEVIILLRWSFYWGDHYWKYYWGDNFTEFIIIESTEVIILLRWQFYRVYRYWKYGGDNFIEFIIIESTEVIILLSLSLLKVRR